MSEVMQWLDQMMRQVNTSAESYKWMHQME
jgi:hypothetical protein